MVFRVQIDTPAAPDPKILKLLRGVARCLNTGLGKHAIAPVERADASPDAYSLTIAVLPDPT